MSIKIQTSTITGPGDPSWLGSAHGTDATRSITLDAAKFTAGTHYPNGYVRGGTPVGKITANGLYGPYKGDATDGTETLVGFVYGDFHVPTGVTRLPVALLDHGKVRESRLPIAVDAAGKTDVAGRIQFV